MAPVVFSYRDYRSSSLHLCSKEFRLRVRIDVPCMCCERKGHTGEFVSEHGNGCRSRGEVGMEVGDWVASQLLCQITGLKETSQDIPPAIAQGVRQRLKISTGLPACNSQVAEEDFAVTAMKRQIKHRCSHICYLCVYQLLCGIFGRENPQIQPAFLQAKDLVQDKSL